MTFVNHLKNYTVEFTESAKKDLKKIDKQVVKLITKKLELLVSGYQNLDIKKLVAYEIPTYRLRVGMYRVIYIVIENMVLVRIIQIDHRKDAY